MANEPNYSSNPSKDEPKKEKVRVIPLEYIDEFPGHPFKVLDDESMQKLMNSIEEIGVQSPIVARIKEDQRYEIISGHRRVHACRRLGLKLIPAIVRDLSRDEAIIAKIRRALSDTGKEKSFGVACAVALLLMILGCVGAIVIGNPFLAPVLAIALAMIPFLYLLRTVEQYEEQVKVELETGLSAITSSYERTMNLKNAVEENIDNLKPPVKGLFQSFLVEISVINPDVKAAICHLRERVKDSVWEEWCDTLISCQDDSQLIGTLYPVVEKLTDMRIVNAELKVMISENKREYYIMALMVVANIPLLYFLNKEWYGALMYTTFGKVTLAICGAVMLFTFLRMQKYCKPVEYRR